VKSYRDIGRISSDTEEGLAELQSVCSTWLRHLREQKSIRSLQWFENASYLLGNHFTRYFYKPSDGFGIHTYGIHDKSSYDQTIAKCADNRLVRPVETVLGMLTDSDPNIRCEPGSDNPEDVDAAKVAEDLIDILMERPINLQQRRRELGLIAMICGSAFCETEFAEIDYPLEVPKTKTVDAGTLGGEPGTPAEIEDGVEVTWMRDATVKVYTPFHIQADPGATSMEDAVWIARTTFEDITWIQEKFGVTKRNKKKALMDAGFHPDVVENLKSTPMSAHPLYWWQKFQDILESPQVFGGGFSNIIEDSGSNGNMTSFTVMDVKPTLQYPQGRTIVLAGDEIIFCGPARAWSPQYPERWHKLGKFDWFKMPGRFIGVALLSLLVPLQKKINSIDVLVQANRQYMSIGQWKLPRHSRVGDGAISGIPGHHILFTALGGMPDPEKVDHKGLPQELLMERAQLIQAINDISSAAIIDNNEVAASAARSGTIFDFLRAEKLRSKSPMLRDFEQALESIGQNLLIEIQLNKEDPALIQRIQLVGRESANSALRAFGAASIRDHHAIKIDVTSGLRRTPEALEQKAMEFLQTRGVNATPAEVEMVQRATGLDKFSKDAANQSIDKARRMVRRIAQGDLEALMPMEGVEDVSVMAPIFQAELLSERMFDYPKEVSQKLFEGFAYYSDATAQKQAEAEMKQLQMTAALAQAEASGENVVSIKREGGEK
jgi:hypothetical protein